MIIYKKYNQEQLNLQYNNRYHVPAFEKSLQQWETLSRLAEKKYKVVKDIAYGDEPRELLDVFPSSKPDSKTLVFIHGGYWQKFDNFTNYDITTVLISYPLMPAVSMDQVVASCHKAVDWVKKNIVQFNGDPDQVYVAGHSAGGHLAAMLMAKDITRSNQHNLKGICAISGLYNLIPIQLSNINDVLQMDKETAIRNSPVFNEPVESCSLLLAVGSEETEEYSYQSQELNSKWKNKNLSIELLEISGLNHFSILDSIVDKESVLHLSICKMMKLV